MYPVKTANRAVVAAQKLRQTEIVKHVTDFNTEIDKSKNGKGDEKELYVMVKLLEDGKLTYKAFQLYLKESKFSHFNDNHILATWLDSKPELSKKIQQHREVRQRERDEMQTQFNTSGNQSVKLKKGYTGSTKRFLSVKGIFGKSKKLNRTVPDGESLV